MANNPTPAANTIATSDFDLTTIVGLSHLELCNNETALRSLMNTINIGKKERDHVIEDGHMSMKEILSRHANDVDSFPQYLNSLNETSASSGTVRLRMCLSPVAIQRFTGILHYFNQSINTFHVIPNILNITTESASTNYRLSHL